MKKNLVAYAFALVFLAVLGHDVHARKSGQNRTVPIDMIVIHSTGGPTCDAKTGLPIWVGAGDMETNMRTIEAHPQLGIHYMIDRNGSLRASIPESRVAHHVFRYSERSIAIELINDGDGRDPFPDAQMTALVALLKEIRQRHSIARALVKRHSDLDTALSPCDPTRRRKVDPGDAFEFDTILNRVYN